MALEEFHSPTSSIILSGRYDPETKRMTLELKNDYYVYEDIPPDVWAGLMAAESKGTYFIKEIRPKYLGRTKV